MKNETKIIEDYKINLTDDQLKVFNNFLDDLVFIDYESEKFFYFQGMEDAINIIKSLKVML